VLATVHPDRGADAVPVVFAVVGDRIVLPVDTVKPKRRPELGRMANVARDPRCVLLVEHYSEDWSQLWWVRIHGLASVERPTAAGTSQLDPAWLSTLAERYPQYGAPGAIVAVMVLRPTLIRGWAAGRA
jgi:PPOX class probable F420-dependent enzyme